MSNHLIFDSLLVRELARELNGLVAGQRLHAVQLDHDARALIIAAGGTVLGWDLRPGRGWLSQLPRRRIEGNVRLPGACAVTRVSAPVDDRLLVIRASAPEGPQLDVVVELIPNRWNVFVVDVDSQRTIAALTRTKRGPAPGEPYVWPKPTGRAGAGETLPLRDWTSIFARAEPSELEHYLIRHVAFVSVLNVGYILDQPTAPAAYARWLEIVHGDEPRPCRIRGGTQPYPYPVEGGALPAPTLLSAFTDAAAMGGEALVEPRSRATQRSADALESTSATLDRVRQRRSRLERQVADALPEAARLRREADLLLAQAKTVERGAKHALLDDFAGGTLKVVLDPSVSVAENAERRYVRARKRERAARRLPALIASALEREARLTRLIERIEAGDPDALAEAPRALPQGSTRGKQRNAPALPYRIYRTTSGLEVRVGRGAKSNDALTFHHSAPEDIWMHARDVAGAHVVLRWPDRVANPPAPDLAEAAVLAALHSRARTSGTVPVDWTRRKYVRKPRKAGPGRVVMERARTLFVEPDEEVERRLRDPDSIDS